ncbi:hypothetical protein RF11_11580 [Thelohanellus kitauei]|uniref:Kelch domain-containing protein 10 n=1 Tax=Thelohanellus kitauei TaxID=669202 RepID=A0A0C2N2T8_THEKT|nr:hypothetical protein RF11_11580 [Thelohanellus kitauei]
MACAVRNLVYIFGADVVHDLFRLINSLFSFNVTNGTWETVYSNSGDRGENNPQPIYFPFIFSHHESLYVMGNGESVDQLGVIYKFCLKTLTWSLVQQIGEKPIFVHAFNGTVYKNKLYIFDGNPDATNRFREVNIFDISTNKWSRRLTSSNCQDYPLKWMCESYAFSSSCAYMSCGLNVDISAHFTDTWRIDLDTLEWVKIDDVCKHFI